MDVKLLPLLIGAFLLLALIRIFRSPELIVKLTEDPADTGCVKRVLEDE